MDNHRSVVIVGGTHGIGKELARRLAADQDEVVAMGRDAGRAEGAAGEVGGRTRGLAFDLANPSEIAPALKNVGPVQYLVLAAIERDDSKVRQYDPARAMRLVTMKIVGNTEVVHALGDRLADDGSILIFGGEAKDKPYPGSSMISAVNAAVAGLVRTMVSELAPTRVNAIHAGIGGDRPYWSVKTAATEGARSKTPTGRLPTMKDVVDASVFLLTNPAANGVELQLAGGCHL